MFQFSTSISLKTWAFLFLLNLSLLFPVEGFDQSYWVWQRTTPLRAEEARDLREANVTQLYWHVGTVHWDGAAWRWHERLRLDWPALRESCPGIAVVPVVRIETVGALETFPQKSRAPLIQLLNELVTTAGANNLQLDYESPDRLIGEYAGFLHDLKDQGRSWRLSISALGHWSKFAGNFSGCADEITPMFYDLDPALEYMGREGLPPLVEPGMAKALAAWHDCPLPWRAGLPNFSRVTILDPNGKSRGNLRSWSWDAIFLSSFLHPFGPTNDGQTLFTVSHDAFLGYTPIKSQEHLSIRYPDREQLLIAQQTANTVGAKGALYFHLADSSSSSAYSVRDLGTTNPAAAAFIVKKDSSGRFILTNSSSTDLLPIVRGAEKDDRGYALELDAPSPLWREVISGDFARATSLGTGTNGLGVAHLQFWFTHLAAGNSLATGYIDQTSPGQPGPLRWRIRNLEKENIWHPLD